MAKKIIEARVIQKVGTEAEWLQNDLVLYKGEIALVSSGGNVINMKVGDGVHTFAELEYMYRGGFEGSINPTTTTSTLPNGFYFAETSGTYTNANNVVVAEGYYTILEKNDNGWKVSSEVKMPTLSPTGVVEQGNTEAVSGGEVYKNAITKLEYIKNINLYDYAKDIQGYYINTGTGALTVSANSSISNVIDVRRLDKIIIQDRTGTSSYRYLSESGTPMKALDKDGIEFSQYEGASNGVELYKPAGAVGFQFGSILTGTGNPSIIHVNDTGSKELFLDKHLTKVQDLEDLNNELFTNQSINKYTGIGIEDSLIQSGSGNVSTYSNSTISGSIPVKPNTYYYLTRQNAGTNAIVGYKSNGTTKIKVLSANGIVRDADYNLPSADGTASVNSGVFKTASDCYFINIGIRYNNTTVSSYNDVMLEELGSVLPNNFEPKPYQPYDDSWKIKESALPTIENKVNKQIKILVVGNSFSKNSFGLVPKILSQIAPDLDFVIGIAYDGGSPLVQHYANFTNTTQILDETTYTPTTYQFHKNSNNTGWGYVSGNIDTMLANEKWDVITFQQSGGQSDLDFNTYYKPYINKLHKVLYNKLNRGVKLGWISIHGSYKSNDSELLLKYENTIINTLKVLNTTSTSVLFPYGTAIQNARTTSLKLIGEGSAKNLMIDNAHLQPGIGELTANYCNALVLLNEVGINASVLGNKIEVLSTDGMTSGSVLGMTENNRFLAQASAINAIKKPYEVTDISVIESDM